MKTIRLQETVATSGAGEENGKGAGLVKLEALWEDPCKAEVNFGAGAF